MALKNLLRVPVFTTVLLCMLAPLSLANWRETFANGNFDLPNWQFFCWPDITKTFTHSIEQLPGTNNYYLSLDEATSYELPTSAGSAFGMAFGSSEEFTDVRVGAVINVAGDAARHQHGFGARTSYFLVPPGSTDPPPGLVASAYVVRLDAERGPANSLLLVVEKVVQLQNIMDIDYQVEIPGFEHDRSYYMQLDVVGSNPVYVTASLYDYPGGVLIAKVPTLVDTSGKDPWEDGSFDQVFVKGLSGIFAMNERPDPAGYHTTFDDVFSISDGPAAVYLGPPDGATELPPQVQLTWVEPAFAISRQLWFGPEGAMELVNPAPGAGSYTTPPLEMGQSYQWRVDVVGPSTTVPGFTYTFTVADYLVVDDIESYTDDSPERIFEIWIDGWDDPNNGSIVGYDNPGSVGKEHIVETEIVHSGGQSMPFYYDNSGPVNYSEAVAQTADLPIGSDWTRAGVTTLAIFLQGKTDNTEDPLYVRLEDNSGRSHTVVYPKSFVCQSESWRPIYIDLRLFADAGLDLQNISRICLGFGDKTGTVAADGAGLVYIDDIRLYRPQCFNPGKVDLTGDVNNDCVVDFADFAALAENWLNSGLSVLP